MSVEGNGFMTTVAKRADFIYFIILDFKLKRILSGDN